MRIVLTGATGFLGSNLLKRLLVEQHEIHCILRKTSNSAFIDECGAVEHIYEKMEDLYDIMEQIQPELVIHVAGMFINQHSIENLSELIKCNIEFPMFVFDAANLAGCRCGINTNSYWQYYKENSYSPVNLYAATKQALEDIITYYTDVCEWKIISLTMFDVYGANDSRRKIINIIHSMKDGDKIDLSSGLQKMCFCHIDDAVDSYVYAMKLLEKLPYGVRERYAVRGQKAYLLKEVINKYIYLARKKLDLRWGKREQSDREITNPERIGELMPGWNAKYSMEEGLKKYIDDWEA